MGLMTGKNALIFGVANERSIAWGITKAFHREGAKIGLSYAGDAFKDRVLPLAPQVDAQFVEACDVGKDDQIDALFAKAKTQFGSVDVVVHAIAFAKKEDLESQYVTTSRDGRAVRSLTPRRRRPRGSARARRRAGPGRTASSGTRRRRARGRAAAPPPRRAR